MAEKKAFKERRSPLGVREFLVPQDQWSEVLGNARAMTRSPSGEIYYRDLLAGLPSLQTHERIHSGQLRVTNPPDDQVESAIGDAIAAEPAISQNPALEAPAYTFETYEPLDQRQQPAYNRYIDLLYSMNPGSTAPVEAAMPDPLQREYVKSHPRPIVRPSAKFIKPIGLADMQIGKRR